MSMLQTVDLKTFSMNNPARDFRDKIIGLYDEFICTKITSDMSLYDRD